jgi:hypothetical protein
VLALSWRAWFLLALVAAGAFALAVAGPIVQPQTYHDFADKRTLLGIPNAWNVLSNLPFLAAGLCGLGLLARGGRAEIPSCLRPAYAVFFVATALVSAGSAWYHGLPSDATLAWDRLPMAVAFTAFLVAILGERVHADWIRLGLIPAMAFGALTVVWWRVSGDLRPYLLAQFLPIVLIPAILVLYPARLPRAGWMWAVLLAYLVAKAFEMLDASVYDWLGISGHTLKHLVAAAGVYFVARMIRSTAPRPGNP